MFWRKKEQDTIQRGPIEWLVVGLGNPGREYENTRHNAGFLAMDQLAKKMGVKIDRLKFKSLCGDGMIGAHRVLLMKPSTFMNLSGEAVCQAMQFYKIPIERVLVLYDDVSLDVGQLRLRRKGSDGGHNGIKNILYLTGKDGFPRIKIGVGKKPHAEYPLADWVLGKFSAEDTKVLDRMFEDAADAAQMIVEGQMDKAMNQYNTNAKQGKDQQ